MMLGQADPQPLGEIGQSKAIERWPHTLRRLDRAVVGDLGVFLADEIEDGTQATHVERRVVGHEVTLKLPLQAWPQVCERRRVPHRLRRDAVHADIRRLEKVGLRPDEGIELIDDPAVSEDRDSDRADARPLTVGRLKIESGKDCCACHQNNRSTSCRLSPGHAPVTSQPAERTPE